MKCVMNVVALAGEEQHMSQVTIAMYAFSCREPRTLAAFWSELIGLPVADGATDELAMLDPEGNLFRVCLFHARMTEVRPH